MLFCLLFCWGWTAPGGPIFSCPQRTHDFGIVERGRKVSHEFQFTNEGDADLVIESVRTSCGCTTASLDKKIYQPGESGSIPVIFDSAEFTGTFAKAVRLTTNEGLKLERELIIRGEIVEDIAVSPAVLREDARRGSDHSWEVAVSTRLDRLEIEDLRANSPYFSVDWRRVDARNGIVKVTLLSEKVSAHRIQATGEIRFRTNSVNQPEVAFRAEIDVVEAIKAEPRAIHFFAVKKGNRQTRALELTSMDGKAFKVTGYESSLDFIKLTWESDRMVVLFTGEAEPGHFNGNLTINTDLPEMPLVPVEVRGSVR